MPWRASGRCVMHHTSCPLPTTPTACPLPTIYTHAHMRARDASPPRSLAHARTRMVFRRRASTTVPQCMDTSRYSGRDAKNASSALKGRKREGVGYVSKGCRCAFAACRSPRPSRTWPYSHLGAPRTGRQWQTRTPPPPHHHHLRALSSRGARPAWPAPHLLESAMGTAWLMSAWLRSTRPT